MEMQLFDVACNRLADFQNFVVSSLITYASTNRNVMSLIVRTKRVEKNSVDQGQTAPLRGRSCLLRVYIVCRSNVQPYLTFNSP